jgi:hypothetical protein
MKSLICVFLIAAAATAQSSPGAVGGPLLGIVFDPGVGGIRPLTGIPAAASLGGPLDAGAALAQAAVSAAGFAVAIESDSGTAVLVTSSGRQPLPGIPAGAAALALSPRGTSATLYFKSTRTAYVVTGLPDSPQAPRTVALDRQPMRLAVSDDGSALLAVERLTKSDAAVVLYRGSTPTQLRSGRGIAGVDFLPGSSDALIAESAAVYLISEAFGPQLIAGEGDGVTGVTAAAASADGARVMIAMQSGQVAIRDRNTNALSTVTCACSPTGLARLRGTGVFRLNEIDEGPLWLLDAGPGEPRLLFVAGERQ